MRRSATKKTHIFWVIRPKVLYNFPYYFIDVDKWFYTSDGNQAKHGFSVTTPTCMNCTLCTSIWGTVSFCFDILAVLAPPAECLSI